MEGKTINFLFSQGVSASLNYHFSLNYLTECKGNGKFYFALFQNTTVDCKLVLPNETRRNQFNYSNPLIIRNFLFKVSLVVDRGWRLIDGSGLNVSETFGTKKTI